MVAALIVPLALAAQPAWLDRLLPLTQPQPQPAARLERALRQLDAFARVQVVSGRDETIAIVRWRRGPDPNALALALEIARQILPDAAKFRLADTAGRQWIRAGQLIRPGPEPLAAPPGLWLAAGIVVIAAAALALFLLQSRLWRRSGPVGRAALRSFLGRTPDARLAPDRPLGPAARAALQRLVGTTARRG